MKVINAYWCETCQKEYERWVDPSQPCNCKVCDSVMEKKLAAAMTNGNSAHGMLHKRTF